MTHAAISMPVDCHADAHALQLRRQAALVSGREGGRAGPLGSAHGSAALRPVPRLQGLFEHPVGVYHTLLTLLALLA